MLPENYLPLFRRRPDRVESKSSIVQLWRIFEDKIKNSSDVIWRHSFSVTRVSSLLIEILTNYVFDLILLNHAQAFTPHFSNKLQKLRNDITWWGGGGQNPLAFLF